MYDLVIIGGGPAGYVAAERAGEKGLKTILFDKRELGGVCLNEGCIPTKTLLYAAKLYDYSKEGKKYGIHFGESSFDFPAMMKRKDKVVKKLVGGVSSKMKKFGVVVKKEFASIKSNVSGVVTIESESGEIQAKNLLIATGSEAFIPPIKGIENVQVLTNREILQLKEVPESLVIIGGGVIGTEFASLFASLEVKVSVIEMMSEILPGNDPDLVKGLKKELQQKGIEFITSAKVTEINNHGVIYECQGKKQKVSGEHILMSVGRKANIKNIGLEKVGVELSRQGIKTDSKSRTNIPNIYAAGDVNGKSLLAHTASREAEVAVNNISGERDLMRYNAIPAVVYTNPELSSVGLTEQAARDKGIEYNLLRLPMAYAGRFIAENEGKNGICKILTGKKYNEVLGVHMLGNPSSEIIYGAAMAIEMQMSVNDMQEVVFPHPTVSEIFKETVFTI